MVVIDTVRGWLDILTYYKQLFIRGTLSELFEAGTDTLQAFSQHFGILDIHCAWSCQKYVPSYKVKMVSTDNINKKHVLIVNADTETTETTKMACFYNSLTKRGHFAI